MLAVRSGSSYTWDRYVTSFSLSENDINTYVYYQVFMGWIWFIPAFHMPELSFASGQQTAKFFLTRKEVDFPLGIGSGILDVEICLEWLRPTDTELVQPPARLSSQEEEAQGKSGEPSGVAAVHAITAATVTDVIHAKQAAED
jgi:phosphatidylinositol-3,4,5-trisphosphate 3-phosphatase/dual-specificity protein phosphatase PTEN